MIMVPRKHKTFVYHLYNDGRTSKTLGRRCTNGIQMFCVRWVEINNNQIRNSASNYVRQANVLGQ